MDRQPEIGDALSRHWMMQVKGNYGGSYRNFQLRSLYQGTERMALSDQGRALLVKALANSATPADIAKLEKEYYLNHAPSLAELRQEVDALKREFEGKRYVPLTISAKPRNSVSRHPSHGGKVSSEQYSAIGTDPRDRGRSIANSICACSLGECCRRAEIRPDVRVSDRL